MIQAIEEAMHPGYPTDAEAILIIEVDGPAANLEHEAEIITECCKANNVREVRVAKDQAERDHLWAGRRAAFGAVGYSA